MPSTPVRWSLSSFDDLSRRQLYALLAARAAVFVVEQDCPYQDLDGLDEIGWHLVATGPDESVLAYARILPPRGRFAEPSVGRVLTTQASRGRGLGRELMRRALDEAERRFPGHPVRISAQQYLERFYAELGFATVRGPYLEDNIPHLEMLREPSSEQ